MKILLPQPAARRLILLSGASCLVGWLLGSQSALLATSSAECVSKAGRPLVAPPWPYPDSLDALVAAPNFHRVLFENERVRVLEVTVPPHQREPVHTHRWPRVLYKEQTGRGGNQYNWSLIYQTPHSQPPPAPPNQLLWGCCGR